MKRPSAEILQQLAKGLEVSAESLYVKAGILDEEFGPDRIDLDVRRAIQADAKLTARQKKTLLDVYESFVDDEEATAAHALTQPAPKTRTTRITRSTPKTPHGTPHGAHL